MIMCSSSEGVTFHVIVEQEPIHELSTLPTAVVHTLGAYFIFDIAYPKPLNALLVMMQHYILGLEDSQRDPPAVVEIVTVLKNIIN